MSDEPQRPSSEDPEPAPARSAARRIAAASELLSLADAVSRRTDRARRQLDELDVALDRLRHGAGTADAPQGTSPASAEGDESSQANRRGAAGAHETARLVAVELLGAGWTRADVERRLREEFGMDDPGPVLDDVFGDRS